MCDSITSACSRHLNWTAVVFQLSHIPYMFPCLFQPAVQSIAQHFIRMINTCWKLPFKPKLQDFIIKKKKGILFSTLKFELQETGAVSDQTSCRTSLIHAILKLIFYYECQLQELKKKKKTEILVFLFFSVKFLNINSILKETKAE